MGSQIVLLFQLFFTEFCFFVTESLFETIVTLVHILISLSQDSIIFRLYFFLFLLSLFFFNNFLLSPHFLLLESLWSNSLLYSNLSSFELTSYLLFNSQSHEHLGSKLNIGDSFSNMCDWIPDHSYIEDSIGSSIGTAKRGGFHLCNICKMPPQLLLVCDEWQIPNKNCAIIVVLVCSHRISKVDINPDVVS